MANVLPRRHFRRLPHFDVPGLLQHVTFHLADGLPRNVRNRFDAELKRIPEDERKPHLRELYQAALDDGMGSCLLQEAENARIVEYSLIHGDTERYRLLSWTIMPNHVHVLVETTDKWPLPKVVQSWKRHTSRAIRARANGYELPPGRLWNSNYWDRYVRNQRHFEVVRNYIENNPVAAGLVSLPQDWRWGSARLRLP